MKTKIEGGIIIGFDGTKHVLLEKGEVVFEDNKVIYVGSSFGEKVDRTIDATSKLVLPGLINIHTHSLSALLMFRGILEDEGHTLYKYLLPVRYGTSSMPPFAKGKDAYFLSQVTLLEILKSGVTTVLEQTDNLEDVLKISQTLGIRLYGCHSYYNGMPFEENGKVVYPKFTDACPGFDENLRLVREYGNTCDGRIKVWLGPHAADTCSVDLLKETRKKAYELKVGIGTHIAQSLTEVSEVKRRVQKTPVEYLADLGFLGEDVTAAHAIYTTSSDVEIMAQSQMNVAHCASSFIVSGQPVPLARYRKRGINVVIGTDQNAMDLIDEMRLAMFSSRLNENDPFATTCLDMFNAVTLNAAKALGRNDIGRIAPGSKADIILINLDQPHLTPFRDPLKILLYHANRNDVDTVIVDGQVLMSERKVLTVDEKEVISKAKEVTKRIWNKIESQIGLPKFLID
jgi:cytosine/adenosine deaminase-related metal-dependent hydrolase